MSWFTFTSITAFIKKLITSWANNPSPISTSTTTSTTTKPSVLSDDPSCNIVIKKRGMDVHNKGQVTYINRVLTSQPFDDVYNVCVQYNDTVRGEVTVWKETSNKAVKVDNFPKDCGIDKIVIWYEG